MSQIDANPVYKKFKVQGENRFLAKVYKNEDQVTASGITIPATHMDAETTGVVLSLSPVFDKAAYPDVRPGASVKVVHCTWRPFPCHGEQLAFGAAEHIIAAYDVPEIVPET